MKQKLVKGYNFFTDEVSEEEAGGGASILLGYNVSDRWAVEFSGQLFGKLSTTHKAYDFDNKAAVFVRKQTVTASANQLSARYKFSVGDVSNWYCACWCGKLEC